MLRILSMSIGTLALASCGGAKAPPAAPVDPGPPVSAPAATPPPAETVASSPTPVAPAAPALVIATPCRGDHLDLAKLLANPTQASPCVVKAAAQPLPPSITVAIAPTPITVASGQQTSAALVLTNTTSNDITLLLSNTCNRAGLVTTALRDRHGKQVDVAGDPCEEGGVCNEDTVGFTIEAHGTAQVAFEVDGWTNNLMNDCSTKRGKKLATGTYELTVKHSLGTFTAPVLVNSGK